MTGKLKMRKSRRRKEVKEETRKEFVPLMKVTEEEYNGIQRKSVQQ